MPRTARIVVPGCPHHITQRGIRRLPTFFDDSDYKLYLALLEESCHEASVSVWAYCLMPNHVHLIVVPDTDEGLREGIGRTHQRYTREINRKMNWRGYLWQGRFASFPMNESYLLVAARYVELNPVKAEMVEAPEDYRWSSAHHHMGIYNDPLLADSPLRELVPDWKKFLLSGSGKEKLDDFKRADQLNRPLGL